MGGKTRLEMGHNPSQFHNHTFFFFFEEEELHIEIMFLRNEEIYNTF